MNRLIVNSLLVFGMAVAAGCATPAGNPPPAVRPTVVEVTAQPADKGAARLAQSLKGTAEAQLAARGYKVASGLTPDARVELAVSRLEKARLDDWRVYEGALSVRVLRAGDDARLLSEESFKAEGERALDEAKAEQGVQEALKRQLQGYLDRSVTEQAVPLVQPVR